MSAKDMSKVKLPVFIYDSPQALWIKCESIFSTYKIKNGTEKYNHLIANLTADVNSKLLYILSHPIKQAAKGDLRLDMLKEALFQRYSPTDYRCFLSYTNMKPLQPGQNPLSSVTTCVCVYLHMSVLTTTTTFSGTGSSHCCPHRHRHSAWP